MLRVPDHTVCRFAVNAVIPLGFCRAALCRRLAFRLFQRQNAPKARWGKAGAWEEGGENAFSCIGAKRLCPVATRAAVGIDSGTRDMPPARQATDRANRPGKCLPRCGRSTARQAGRLVVTGKRRACGLPAGRAARPPRPPQRRPRPAPVRSPASGGSRAGRGNNPAQVSSSPGCCLPPP